MIDGVRFHTITGLGRCPFVKQTAPLIFFGVTTWIRAGRFFSVYQSVQVRIHTLFPQIQVQVRTLFARSRQAPRMRGYLNELWLLMTHVAKINKVKGVGQQNQQNGLTKSAWIWVRTLVVRRISWKLLIFIIIRWFTDNLPPCCWGSLWSSPRAIRNSFGEKLFLIALGLLQRGEIPHCGALSETGNLDGDFSTLVFLIPHLAVIRCSFALLSSLATTLFKTWRIRLSEVKQTWHHGFRAYFDVSGKGLLDTRLCTGIAALSEQRRPL